MRCPKCHFVSFDHLAQCKKCGTDLSTERERLNLLNFEPAMPQFFGLLDQADLDLQAPVESLAPSPSAELQGAEAKPPELAEQGTAPVSIELVMPVEPAAAAGELEPAAIQPEAAAGLPELILEDRDQGAELELSLDDQYEAPLERAAPRQASPAEAPIEFVLDDDELELELSQEEMERIILELNQDGSGATAPEPRPKQGKPPGRGENS
ncbi:MAG: hypothetical protein AUK55_08780 [Syntrophobacteraceae bacterium CG2_30_61_12]|nr:MAG: hypothetical protein AUK55_08780 [Syntrophobacteraceae bacterium CG2_30_61_12]